jgi:hypothetical protein
MRELSFRHGQELSFGRPNWGATICERFSTRSVDFTMREMQSRFRRDFEFIRRVYFDRTHYAMPQVWV